MTPLKPKSKRIDPSPKTLNPMAGKQGSHANLPFLPLENIFIPPKDEMSQANPLSFGKISVLVRRRFEGGVGLEDGMRRDLRTWRWVPEGKDFTCPMFVGVADHSFKFWAYLATAAHEV